MKKEQNDYFFHTRNNAKSSTGLEGSNKNRRHRLVEILSHLRKFFTHSEII